MSRQIRGSSAILTINRPERRNALTPEVLDSLRRSLTELNEDSGIRSVVLTGSGGTFSAGADLRGDKLGAEAILRDHYEPLVRTIVGLSLPIVAAVEGFAVGAGLALTTACDLRVASRDAYFYLPFAGLGLSPDAGSTWLLPRLIGAGRAAEMALLGSKIDAPTAHSWGLVNAITEKGASLPYACELAESLAEQSSSVGAIKAALHRSWTSTLDDQLEYERALQPALQTLPDYKEAISAFQERRNPLFGPRSLPLPTVRTGGDGR
ncbi:enoyl-CoA hydratase/isomerase family protein [Gordonia rubripertincta]|uniref:Enoyl-CoA hydratase-related protein n=1 Tax=Gordonia rubripertincta TaxID=36822 RepID=A0ABT4MVN6_GORRU|nr:enoyl-CoA hydratase-related protein [Gordonia rubripertincta]MCZ4551067.1 enoyl-CoA hydratase-related protein [Gordonia rubripertincta]